MVLGATNMKRHCPEEYMGATVLGATNMKMHYHDLWPSQVVVGAQCSGV